MTRTFLIILSVVLFGFCKKEPAGSQGPSGSQGPNGPVGTVPTGTLTGSVAQRDETGAYLKTGLNTVTVSIKGTSFNAVTDSDGVYTISSVPAGVYVLEFKSKKSQTCRNTQVPFSGNGVMYLNLELFNKPTWGFSNLSIKDTTQGTFRFIKIAATIPASVTVYSTFLVLFSTNNKIDNTDPSSYDYLAISYSGVPYKIYYNQTVSSSDNTYYTPGYPSGTIYYAKAYALTSSLARYMDVASQQYVYYSVSDIPAQTFTLTMPN